MIVWIGGCEVAHLMFEPPPLLQAVVMLFCRRRSFVRGVCEKPTVGPKRRGTLVVRGRIWYLLV